VTRASHVVTRYFPGGTSESVLERSEPDAAHITRAHARIPTRAPRMNTPPHARTLDFVRLTFCRNLGMVFLAVPINPQREEASPRHGSVRAPVEIRVTG